VQRASRAFHIHVTSHGEMQDQVDRMFALRFLITGEDDMSVRSFVVGRCTITRLRCVSQKGVEDRFCAALQGYLPFHFTPAQDSGSIDRYSICRNCFLKTPPCDMNAVLLTFPAITDVIVEGSPLTCARIKRAPFSLLPKTDICCLRPFFLNSNIAPT
jgi:hypothetical protein